MFCCFKSGTRLNLTDVQDKTHRPAGGNTGEGGETQHAGGEPFLHAARRIQVKVELKSPGWFNTHAQAARSSGAAEEAEEELLTPQSHRLWGKERRFPIKNGVCSQANPNCCDSLCVRSE